MTRRERLFKKVLETSPGNPVALNSLGVIARKRGELDEAVRLFEEGLATAPLRGGPRHIPEGDELKRLPTGQRFRAVRVGLPATGELDTTLTRVSLGITLARKGKFDRAVEQLERAAETYDAIHGKTSPQAADTRRLLGIVHLMAGRPRKGKAAIDEALRAKLALAEDVVPTLSEAEALAFVAKLTERDPALAALRLIPGATADQAYDVVWSTRAMVTRSLAERKTLADSDPKANALIGRLQAVRSRLATLTLRPDTVFSPASTAMSRSKT